MFKYCKGCRTRKDRNCFAPNARICTDCRTKRTVERRHYLTAWRKANGAQAQRQRRAGATPVART